MHTGWKALIDRLRPGAVQPRPGRVDTTPLDDDAPASCGWFESSWELERGLAVAEVSALEMAVWQLVSGEEAASAC